MCVAVVAVGCSSNDDDANDDDTTGDTDATNDTDLPGDTDDTDTTGPTPEGECRPFAPCGGDVVGTWTLDTVCFPDFGNPFAAQCATSTYTLEVIADGTLDIVNDMTYTADFTLAMHTTLSIPTECNSGLTDCNEWDNTLGLACTGDVATGCDCQLTSPPAPWQVTDSWSYVGNKVVFAGLSLLPFRGAAPPQSIPMDFCQDGDTLSLFQGQAPFGVQIDLSL
jgi:hypothetical protein